MVVKAAHIKVCPDCQRNITGLFGRFVEPGNPTEDCPHCGTTVYHEARGLSIRVRK